LHCDATRTTSFTAGDKIELLAEVVVLPKMDGDYYPNLNFNVLALLHGNLMTYFIESL
jgi:hypothetical protein